MPTTAQHEWDDLRGHLAADCAMGLALCGWMAAWTLLYMPSAGLPLVATATGLMILGAWLWGQAPAHPQRSAILLTLGAFVSVCTVWYTLQLTELTYLFALPILLAALLLRTWTTLVVGLGVWLVVYSPLAPPVDVHPSASALLALLCLFQAAVMRGVRKHLQQTQSYQDHVVNLAERARRHQEEVKRLNKSLTLAYAMLQRRTQELLVARQEAENALRLKEQFAVYVSHELRTPLNIMLGFLEILQRYPEVYGDVQWTPTLRRDIAEIQRSARHLLDLVNDLLDLARIDAVKMPIHRESCRLEDVLGEAVDLARRLLTQKPVQLRVSMDSPLPMLYLDRTRIRQVILNLLANAGRFTPQGEIHLHARAQDDEIVISVRDTGIGIAPEHLSTLFQDYAQTPQGGRTGDGKGLGLAIAKRFVQMHGGRIWAESQVGHGSAFFFTVPIHTIQVVPSVRHSSVAPDQPPADYHLLLVDPDPAAAAYLRRQLDGVRVSQTPDLESARRLVREQRPHALLLNVLPDRGDGARSPLPPIVTDGVPVLQCTLPVGKWLLAEDDFDHRLVKPLESRRLLHVLDTLCPAEGTVLLVDDDRAFVQLMQRLFQAASPHWARPYTLRWAYSREEAETALTTLTPALILVDIALGSSDGRSFAQWLRRHPVYRSIPLVAVSSYAPGSDGHSTRSCSFSLTRKEGFSESEVLNLIMQTLRQVRPRYAPWSLDTALPSIPTGTPAL
jgi:signal transduction histidine kinase/CheY-like chemotaxis protein